MPLKKTSEVQAGFIREFLTGTTKKRIPTDSRVIYPMLAINGVDYVVKYFRRSGQTGTQDLLEHYPCIVIQDYMPKVNKELVYGQSWIQGAVDLLAGTRDIIHLPVPLLMKYSVSVTATNGKDIQDAFDWFMNKFNLHEKRGILMNKVEVPGRGTAGDVVMFDCMEHEVPRTDGRFEYVFDFTLKPYIHIKLPTYDTYTNQITVSLTSGNPEGAYLAITEIVTEGENPGDLPTSTFEQTFVKPD